MKLATTSCKPKPKVPDPSPYPSVLLPVSMLPDTFEDGTKVQNTYEENGFLYREGHKGKDCRLSRTEITEGVPDLKISFMRAGGITESCSGISCEHCAFRDGGGCTCKNIGQGVCTHTITKIIDQIKAR